MDMWDGYVGWMGVGWMGVGWPAGDEWMDVCSYIYYLIPYISLNKVSSCFTSAIERKTE